MKSHIDTDHDDWILRTILETYALALDIPLRVYKIEKAKDYYTRAYDLETDFRKYFPTLKEFEQHVAEVATQSVEKSLKLINGKFHKNAPGEEKYELWSKLGETEGDYWYTYRINSYPLLRTLGEHWCWKWWHFCWHYYHFVMLPASEEIKYLGFGFTNKDDRHYLHLSYQHIPDLKYILVAGPVWSPPQSYTPECIGDQAVEMIDKFLEAVPFSERRNRQGENCTTHYEKRRLVRMGNSRFPISKNSLEYRLEQIIKSLQCLLKMQLSDVIELRRSDYTNLAAWSLFTIRTTSMIQGEFHHLCDQENRKIDSFTVYYRLDHALTHENEPTSSWIQTVFHVQENLLPELAWSEDVPTDISDSIDSQLLIKLSSRGNPVSPPCNIANQLNNLFERFLSEIFSKQNGNKLERLFVLRDWINDWFGIFSSNSNEHLSNVAGKLAFHITRFMQADITTLYRYDCSDETLDLLNLYHHTGNKRELWQELEPAHMKKAGKDPEKREQSICYRAVDQLETQFCGFFDPTGKRSPLRAGETLLLPPDGLESHCSGIAAPLLVYGRVWGIVEVLGDRFYQFCVSDKRLLNEVTSVLSSFFYYHWFLKKLYDLNKIVIPDDSKPEVSKPDLDSDKKYNDLCKCLAELFLSYGAALWVFDEQMKGYRCRGVYNRTDSQLGKEVINPKDDKSVIGYMLQQKRQNSKFVWWQGSMDTEPLNDIWQKKQRNNLLVKAGIRSLCSIPVRLQEHDKELAVIILYNKTTECYDERWENLVSFVAQEVALLLQALQAQARWEDENRSFITHELKSGVTMISDRVREIDDWYRQHVWRWARNLTIAEELDRLSILVKDTVIHAAGLQETVKLLGQEDFKTYFRPTDNPIVKKARKLFQRERYPSFLNLRDQFNHVFRSEWNKQKHKALATNYRASCEPSVRIHQLNLIHILTNLMENAIKYSLPNQSIEAKVNCSPHGVELEICNWGRPLAKGEKDHIFQDGYRGHNAVDINGEGKGLFLVRNICELYQIDCRYDSETVSVQENCCKHTITLLFPLTMVDLKEKR